MLLKVMSCRLYGLEFSKLNPSSNWLEVGDGDGGLSLL